MSDTPFIIYPAVDILDGKCVRLVNGKFDQGTIYNHDPVFVARRWESQGAKYLHIVDLDGARSGEPVNIALIRNILNKVNLPVQVGGGIRDIETAEKIIDAGAARLILGSVVIKDPKFTKEALDKFGDKVAVSLDCHKGKLAIEGWAKDSNVNAIDIAKQLKNDGLKLVIYTDIDRDGTLEGPNLEEAKNFAAATGISTIISGGVHNIEDVKTIIQARKDGALFNGVIVGKALYDNKVKPSDLFAL
jgi:phosphoribosylformimino-5-aminoimidazole carboxamide ribotide isomerase